MQVSQPCAKVIRRARKIAKHLGSLVLLPEHFILGMLKMKNTATRFLRKAGIAISEVRKAFFKEIPQYKEHKGIEARQSNAWNIVMSRAASFAKNGRRNSIGTFDVFAAFTETDGIFECIFEACKVAFSLIRQFLDNLVISERRYASTTAIA